MSTEMRKRRLTVAEFHRMGEAGILGPDERVELIEGELIRMTPIGSRHAGTVNRLTKRLVMQLGDRGTLSVQNPVILNDLTEPQPDLLVLRPRPDEYTESHPDPHAVLLLIEVSETSLAYDRSTKLTLYAAAGVMEVWIVDLSGGQIEVHRNPGPQGYRDSHRASRGERVNLMYLPDIGLEVDDILGR